LQENKQYADRVQLLRQSHGEKASWDSVESKMIALKDKTSLAWVEGVIDV
jgi:hypothetical protein